MREVGSRGLKIISKNRYSDSGTMAEIAGEASLWRYGVQPRVYHIEYGEWQDSNQGGGLLCGKVVHQGLSKDLTFGLKDTK